MQNNITSNMAPGLGHIHDPWIRPVVLLVKDWVHKMYHAQQVQSPDSMFVELFQNNTNEDFKHYTLAQMEELCEDIIAGSTLDTLETVLRLIYAIMAIMSMLGLCVVALSIFYNKQLGEHPSPLIARICIIEAIMSWNSLFSFMKPKFIVCYFDAYIFFGPMTG